MTSICDRFDHERCPKRVTVETNRGQEADNPKLPKRRVTQRRKDADRVCCRAGISLDCKCALQPISFRRTQPARCLRPIREVNKHDYAKQNRRHSLDQEQPLPSCESERSM